MAERPSPPPAWGPARRLLRWAFLVAFAGVVFMGLRPAVVIAQGEGGEWSAVVAFAVRVVLTGYALAGLGEAMPRLRVPLLDRGSWGVVAGLAVLALLLVPAWGQAAYWLSWRLESDSGEALLHHARYLQASTLSPPGLLWSAILGGLGVTAWAWCWPAARRALRRFAKPRLATSLLLFLGPALFTALGGLGSGAMDRCLDQRLEAAQRPYWPVCQTLHRSRPPLRFPLWHPGHERRSHKELDLGFVMWRRAFTWAQTRPHSAFLAGLWEAASLILVLNLWAHLLAIPWRIRNAVRRPP